MTSVCQLLRHSSPGRCTTPNLSSLLQALRDCAWIREIKLLSTLLEASHVNILYLHHIMSLQQQEFRSRPAHPPPGAPPVAFDSPARAPDGWYTIAPGIWEQLLNSDNGTPDTDNKSVLQWYEPGTESVDMTRIITHTYYEEVCFIQGELADVTLGQAWGPGAYAFREPGMKHGPYRAGEEGVLQFVKVTPAKSR